jgi:hypothetical protein
MLVWSLKMRSPRKGAWEGGSLTVESFQASWHLASLPVALAVGDLRTIREHIPLSVTLAPSISVLATDTACLLPVAER